MITIFEAGGGYDNLFSRLVGVMATFSHSIDLKKVASFSKPYSIKCKFQNLPFSRAVARGYPFTAHFFHNPPPPSSLGVSEHHPPEGQKEKLGVDRMNFALKKRVREVGEKFLRQALDKTGFFRFFHLPSKFYMPTAG